jgi:hypothetical protein
MAAKVATVTHFTTVALIALVARVAKDASVAPRSNIPLLFNNCTHTSKGTQRFTIMKVSVRAVQGNNACVH